MAPTVLYHCPCQDPISALNPPSLPTLSAAAAYAFHPLEHLYFCDECDAVRCTRCVTPEISCYYCPNCLFEVPGASVRAEKNRCARNCFICPSCTHTLQVVATDPSHNASPLTSAASVGEPPYFLVCSFCKWDSKEVKLTFEKPTGLSLQLQKHEDSAQDMLELERLREHFDPFLRSQTSSSGGPAQSMLPSTGSTATLAASAALQSSNLLRDVPSLANSRYASSLLGLSSRGARKAAGAHREELPEYEAVNSWTSGRATGGQLGVMGVREEGRRELVKLAEREELISGLTQRWQSPWDQPVRASDLQPTRVPLKSKQSKRCPVCRHIVIKPDVKAASNRFKIKLVAQHYLPRIDVTLAPGQPGDGGSSIESRLSRRTSMLALRRRPQSMLGGPGVGLASAGTGPVDEEALQPDRNYTYEMTFSNPLDDAMTVRVFVARPQPPRSEASLTSPSIEQTSGSATKPARAKGWQVSTSTSAFPIHPYNEVWELDEDDADLLGEGSKSEHGRGSGSAGAAAENAGDDVGGGGSGDSAQSGSDDDGQDYKRSRTTGGARRKRRGDGIIRRKGHRTTIGLDLALSREVHGDIEFGLFVTYTYHPEGEESDFPTKSRANEAGDDSKGGSGSDKSFSFWTAVRLGRCVQRERDAETSSAGVGVHKREPSGESVAGRLSALDRRRSVMGGSSSSSSSRPSSVLGGVGGGSLGTVTEGSSARALNSETSAEEGSAPSAPEGIVSTSGQAPPSNASLPSTRRAGSAGGIVDYKV